MDWMLQKANTKFHREKKKNEQNDKNKKKTKKKITKNKHGRTGTVHKYRQTDRIINHFTHQLKHFHTSSSLHFISHTYVYLHIAAKKIVIQRNTEKEVKSKHNMHFMWFDVWNYGRNDKNMFFFFLMKTSTWIHAIDNSNAVEEKIKSIQLNNHLYRTNCYWSCSALLQCFSICDIQQFLWFKLLSKRTYFFFLFRGKIKNRFCCRIRWKIKVNNT